MDGRFTVYPLQEDVDPFDQLCALFHERTSINLSAPYRHTTLLNTLKHAADLGTGSVLLQTHVLDPDFNAEHREYYSQWSSNIPRHCDRYHFFAGSAATSEPIDFIDQKADGADSYLGFITIRPVTTCPVAASVLPPLKTGDTHYVQSKDEFRVNIAGRGFSAHGTPFMQQDNAVGACAQASIWMALRTLTRKEGKPKFSPQEITAAATRFLVRGRTLPNRSGLVMEQILEAIRSAGYATDLIDLNVQSNGETEQKFPVRQALYPYVESGIPVLLALYPDEGEGHAVLLIGHGWDKDPDKLRVVGSIPNEANRAEPTMIYDASSWADPFYIHNDNTGPYQKLPEIAQLGDSYSLDQAEWAIPFLPADVFINAAEAKQTCLKLFFQTLQTYVSLDEPRDTKIPDLVTRVFLVDKSLYRESIYHGTMPNRLKNYYREKWLPQRVWVLELSDFQFHGESDMGGSRCLGQILLDPASEPEDAAFLTIHITDHLLPANCDSGVLIDRDGLSGDITGQSLEMGTFSPYARPVD